MKSEKLQEQTINDFGQQWTHYTDNEGFYGSLDLLKDIISPLLNIRELAGCRIGEIGSGTGRIVNMLLAADVAHVTAVEPSDAFNVLCHNTSYAANKITYLKATGDTLPSSADLDYVFSIGVLHHIPEPEPVVKAAFAALRPGGRFLVWLYAKEGNALYLALAKPLRIITKRLSHSILSILVWLLYWPLAAYIELSKILPLPLHKYMTEVIGRMSPEKRRLIIYDQLNPAYAKYYTYQECYNLMANAGFSEIRIHHRHGYSWTVIGTKPR